MFNMQKEIMALGLLGIGVYCHHNNINLANNTSILALAYLIFAEQQQIDELKCNCEENHRYDRCNHHHRNERHH